MVSIRLQLNLIEMTVRGLQWFLNVFVLLLVIDLSKFSIGLLRCLKFVRLEMKAAKQILPVVQDFKLCYLLN